MGLKDTQYLTRQALYLALTIYLGASPALLARDAKPPTAPGVGGFDRAADIAKLNAFLNDNCYFETADAQAPAGFLLKRRCSGKIDSNGDFLLHNEAGYGPSGPLSKLVVMKSIEDWKIKWRDLHSLPWRIIPAGYPAEPGILLSCRFDPVECASVSSIEYAEDGKTVRERAENKTVLGDFTTIPIDKPKGEIVEGLFRPFERLISENHTDSQTCQQYKCGAYDPAADTNMLNAFLKDSCYFESTDPRAPPSLFLKRKCSGEVNGDGDLSLHIAGGYGLPGPANGLMIITFTEDWEIKWHDLRGPPWPINLDSPPGNGGIAILCKDQATSCGSISLIYYSEDGKSIVAQEKDEKRSGVIATIPINAPKSQIVERLFRPFERLIDLDHTDFQTCHNNKCEP